MLKIAICEDESTFAKALESIICSKLVKLDLHYSIYLFSSGEELLDKIINEEERYDVIFFDVQLPGIDGTETARKVRQIDDIAIFIFITSMNDEIYKILDLKIFNFVRKSHFELEIGSVLDLLVNNFGELIKYYTFPIDEDSISLKLYEILYFEVLNRSVIIHVKNESYTTKYRTLKDIPIDLTENNFYEIYRGIMVNLNKIKDVQDNSITLMNGKKLFISRRRVREFNEIYFKFLTLGKE